MKSGGKTLWKATLLLVVVFVCGLLLGAGGMSAFTLHQFRKAARDPDSSRHGEMVLRRLEERLSSALELTPAEREAVSAELQTTLQEMRTLRVGAIIRGRDIAKDTLLRLERVLPQEKRPELREILRQRLEPWGLNPPDNSPQEPGA